MITKKIYLLFLISVSFTACKKKNVLNESKATASPHTIGKLIRYDGALDALIHKDAVAEVIATGYDWSEGPLLLDDTTLIFSDVPKNTIYRWTPNTKVMPYLTPSGYTGTEPRGGEMGSNGLTLRPDGKLVLCQHGDRRIAMMTDETKSPKPNYISIAHTYNGKKFNSPNDAVYSLYGELFFTDPPYGLEAQEKDPKREIPYQGVYRVTKDRQVTMMVDTLTRPNGIALMPDGNKIIVANSDPEKPNWYIYDYDGIKMSNGKIFYASTEKGLPGLPDGLKIDTKGNVFATGPGGVSIFDKSGKRLGMLSLNEPTSNCALSKDGTTLYITNDDKVVKFKMR